MPPRKRRPPPPPAAATQVTDDDEDGTVFQSTGSASNFTAAVNAGMRAAQQRPHMLHDDTPPPATAAAAAAGSDDDDDASASGAAAVRRVRFASARLQRSAADPPMPAPAPAPPRPYTADMLLSSSRFAPPPAATPEQLAWWADTVRYVELARERTPLHRFAALVAAESGQRMPALLHTPSPLARAQPTPLFLAALARLAQPPPPPAPGNPLAPRAFGQPAAPAVVVVRAGPSLGSDDMTASSDDEDDNGKVPLLPNKRARDGAALDATTQPKMKTLARSGVGEAGAAPQAPPLMAPPIHVGTRDRVLAALASGTFGKDALEPRATAILAGCMERARDDLAEGYIATLGDVRQQDLERAPEVRTLFASLVAALVNRGEFNTPHRPNLGGAYANYARAYAAAFRRFRYVRYTQPGEREHRPHRLVVDKAAKLADEHDAARRAPYCATLRRGARLPHAGDAY